VTLNGPEFRINVKEYQRGVASRRFYQRYLAMPHIYRVVTEAEYCKWGLSRRRQCCLFPPAYRYDEVTDHIPQPFTHQSCCFAHVWWTMRSRV